MTEPETFAQRLHRLRIEQGYGVADLAAAVGASEGTVRQIEAGTIKSPSFLLGIRLADHLHVSPRYLAAGSESSFSQRLDTFEERFAKFDRRLQRLEAMGRR